MSTSPEPPTAPLRLKVNAQDAQSDILILDSKGRLVERGLGPVRTFDLERGIYRVKVVTGREIQERPVVLTETGTTLVDFPPAAFASPVPMVGTSTSHEYHMAAADRESRNVHVRDGVGSSLFFLVRDWTPTSKASTRRKINSNPAMGLFLYAVTGSGERLVADFAKSGAVSLDLDAWSACTIELDPGTYELRLELPTGDTLHQAIVAAPSWQTQAFLFMRDYPVSRDSDAAVERRADLARSSVILSKQVGFSQSEPYLRLAELARVALATSRPPDESAPPRRLVPDELRMLLRQKWDNPMLGIYGCHLLLLETVPDIPLLSEAVSNLRRLVGIPHPDVEALALRAEELPPPNVIVDPPMLRRSWALMIDACAERPELIADALTTRMTTDFWLQGPWHIWRTSAPSPMSFDGTPGDGLSDVEVAVASYLGLTKRARFEANEGSYGTLEAYSAASEEAGLSRLSTRGLRTLGPISARAAGEEKVPTVDPDALRSIGRRLNLSQAQLSGVLDSLQGKLAGSDVGSELSVGRSTLESFRKALQMRRD